MSDLPSMPLFVDDYEAATAHLTIEEDGAYNRLLRLCWRQSDCSVPANDEWIMRKMRCDAATFTRVVKPIIAEFFTRARGRIWQKRQREEHAYVVALSERRRKAGSRGGNAKARKTKATATSKATVLPEQNPSKPLAPIPIPIPIVKETHAGPQEQPFETPDRAAEQSRFSEFWTAYPRKEGMVQAEAEFITATISVSADAIIAGARSYAASRVGEDGKYTLTPAKWLAAKRWTDQIAKQVADPEIARLQRIAATYGG